MGYIINKTTYLGLSRNVFFFKDLTPFYGSLISGESDVFWDGEFHQQWTPSSNMDGINMGVSPIHRLLVDHRTFHIRMDWKNQILQVTARCLRLGC